MAAPAAVIILAAGQGTRMKSELPKVLHEMCGRTLLGHAIVAARGLEPQNVVVVVRHERAQVASHALTVDPEVIIADQDEVKGTGRAVWCGLAGLSENISGPVLVMAGDTPLLTSDILAELFARHGENAVTVLTAQVPEATGYGRIVRDAQGKISGIVEEVDATPQQRTIREINTSTYVFDAAFLRRSLARLGTDNAQGEMYLTDVVAQAYREGAGIGSYMAPDYRTVEGANDLVQLAALRADMRRRILEKWMRAGVSIIDPATTWIDVQAELEPDAVVEPFTILRGNVHIERGQRVGPGEYGTRAN
ncbi:UDP-N-acetylglucosamine diphosphorylase [Actinobaculum suis]|uniref:bifunctional UDP-N-acetylglucosamine diphosphorylase/glucosamine-1-phosphate N-acetyltransferase GlmU n=1 Tax=Actinobaculum suis TaxID=1657 RepID=UPI00066FFF3E|nr:NTP transferase domain-containing protein [Actinobaculum suis]KMY22812.1 UDP-N-acetylglucosamine diphosphorylase [Actinobaculum suis]